VPLQFNSGLDILKTEFSRSQSDIQNQTHTHTLTPIRTPLNER